ncbi:MAG: hypothetical protein JO362_11565 [Streptomycetaceae bacterium]|nr:hypothetical protein [Streptomycetaceae bacterium]
MQIHRSRHASGFTILPNALLQDRRLSYTARGLLADLLSRPDGWSEDGRHMADTSPQGRLAIAKALRELKAFGYYRVDKVRRSDGTFVSEAHVYDTPQPVPGHSVPGLTRPGSGAPIADDRGANPVKNRGKVPTLPGQRSGAAEAREERPTTGTGGRKQIPTTRPARPAPSHADRPAGSDEGVLGEPVAILFRVLRPEPRLRLGMAEALALAPLVTPWLERGYGQRDLAEALLGGLPDRIHSAPALLRDRLTRKLPPAPQPSAPVKPRWTECGSCGRPIPPEGICRTCAGLGDRSDDSPHRAQIAARGRAKVRAALLGDHCGLPTSSRARLSPA